MNDTIPNDEGDLTPKKSGWDWSDSDDSESKGAMEIHSHLNMANKEKSLSQESPQSHSSNDYADTHHTTFTICIRSNT